MYMSAAKGWKQINFQVPQATFDKIVTECEKLGMTKGEFCTRLIVAFFLAREMGMTREIFSFASYDQK